MGFYFFNPFNNIFVDYGDLKMYNILTAKWDEIINKLKNDYDVADVSFRTWILPLSVDSVEDNTLNIIYNGNGNNAEMAIQYIKNKYLAAFEVTIAEVTGYELKLNFVTSSTKKATTEDSSSVVISGSSTKQRMESANLNPRYSFDSFIVGSNNNMAHAVALSVAESPGKWYNPLFIYGGVGLGKTHLMQAIGNYIVTNNPELKVLYISSESFTNELIDIMRSGKKENTDFTNFRNKYRSVDVLMIDDIQFIIGKDRTQEEFFHTFNDLYMREKQVIITSDKPPKDFLLLEERFRTRFESGITVDIQSPDYETRMAILKKNAELKHYDIEESVFNYIADNIVSNVRELEGALKKIILFANLSHQKITLPLAQDVLKDLIYPDSSIKITTTRIIDIVAEHFNITPADILSNKKTKDIAYPRQICMYLSRHLTEDSLSAIGVAFNGKDHSTISHGVNKVKNDINNNPSTRSLIDVLVKKIDPN